MAITGNSITYSATLAKLSVYMVCANRRLWRAFIAVGGISKALVWFCLPVLISSALWPSFSIAELLGNQAIGTGGSHTCVLTTAGGVKCWGANSSGQLGDGSTTNRTMAVDSTGLLTGIQAVIPGGQHTCVLSTAGGVKCWGYNLYGQLGDGSTTNRTTAVSSTGLSTGVQGIALGGNHSCALTTAGGVKCWGANNFGQLGDGSTTCRATAIDATGLSSGIQAVTLGFFHTCALTTAGGVKCWGATI